MSYNRNQPRVPAGHEGAGQWSDGESATRSILNSPLLDRDRLIKAALGIRDDEKRGGNVRLALLDSQKSSEPLRIPDSRDPEAAAAPAPIPLGVSLLLGGALLLGALSYAQLSELNSDKQRTIIVFRRGKYRSESDTDLDWEGLRILRSPQEITKVCGEGFDEIQKLVDDTYDEVKKDMPYLSEQDLGTEVHKRVAWTINETWDRSRFTAELTYGKSPPIGQNGEPPYGARDSIRLDVYYRSRDRRTVCVAEIKTGRKVLDFDRMQEVVVREAARDTNKEIQEFLVTEVRPKNGPAGRRLRGAKPR